LLVQLQVTSNKYLLNSISKNPNKTNAIKIIPIVFVQTNKYFHQVKEKDDKSNKYSQILR